MGFLVRVGGGFTGDNATCTGVALAAILGEIGQQVIHHRVFGRVDQRPAFAPKPKLLADLAGWHPVHTGPNQQPKDIKPGFLRESCQSGNGVYLLQVITSVEISVLSQGAQLLEPKIC